MFFGIHNLLTLCFLALLLYFCMKYLPVQSGILRNSVATICVLSVVSCYFFVFNSNWLMSNHISTILFATAVLSSYIYIREQKKLFWWFAIAANILFAFSRIETLLFGILHLYFLLSMEKESKNRIIAAIPHSIFTSLWVLSIRNNFGNIASDFLTSERSLLIVGVCIALVVFLFLSSRISLLRALLSPRVTLCGSLLAMIGIGVVKYDVLQYNLGVLFENLFSPGGYWGITWFMILICYVLSLGRKMYQSRVVIGGQIIIYCALTVTVFLFRADPLRLGFGDSGNRMMLTILPLLIVDIVFELFNKPEKKNA